MQYIALPPWESAAAIVLAPTVLALISRALDTVYQHRDAAQRNTYHMLVLTDEAPEAAIARHYQELQEQVSFPQEDIGKWPLTHV